MRLEASALMSSSEFDLTWQGCSELSKAMKFYVKYKYSKVNFFCVLFSRTPRPTAMRLEASAKMSSPKMDLTWQGLAN